jgi:diguanylate cyclase (GGDEF)-like protein/PAS domain S-box-containing protein
MQSPIKDGKGEVVAVSLIFRDISQRKRDEAERAQLAAIVESSNDAIVSRDLAHKITSWNTAAQRLFGWSAEEAVGRPISMIVPPGREAEIEHRRARTDRGESIPPYDSVRRAKDGRTVDVAIAQSPIRDADGKLTGVALMFRDIRDRKKAEQEQALLAAIVANSNDAIISRSLDGRFISWNKGAERMFGYTAAEAIGQPTTLILPPEDHKDVVRKLEFTRHGKYPVPYETRRVTKDGRLIDVVASVSPIRNAAGEINTVSIIFHDITERKRAQQRISFLSQYDTLTGLPNRDLFRDRLGLALVRARRQGETVGVMLFNLDRFKRVNEGLGLEAGDELLRQVAARLKDTLRDVDTVARLGGDEFAILVESTRGSADISAVAEKLIERFAAPFEVTGNEVVAIPSIGVTLYPSDTDDSQKLLEHAEIAMGRVKREGGGGYRLYDTEPATIRGGHLGLEMRLRHALERGELDLHYQPKVRLLDGAITGAEALLRWNSPDLGPVSPAKFIPVAEESGLIVPIGEWVLRTACAQMRAWHELGLAFGIAVNLSPRQFRQKDLSGVVADALRQSGLAPDRLELEITEGTAMANAEQTVTVLGSLHSIGVRLSVDDFGTGYSSLSYLKRFPLDNLKIDRSFVLDVGNDPNGEAIVYATIALARSLKLKTIAEGVETAAQRDFLARAGCDEMQGYLFSRPLPAAEFQALIERPRTSTMARK